IGFLKLYKKLGEENSFLDHLMDNGLLYASVVLFLLIRLTDPTRPLTEWLPHIPVSPDSFHKIFGAILVLYTLRQFYLLKRGCIFLPKLLFLFAIISTYYFTYVIADPPFALIVAL